MKKHETIQQHAKRISELDNSISELARCEGKRFEDYTVFELINTAKNLLDIMGDWDDPDICDVEYTRQQRRLLKNFIKKWEA